MDKDRTGGRADRILQQKGVDKEEGPHRAVGRVSVEGDDGAETRHQARRDAEFSLEAIRTVMVRKVGGLD